jgi:poly-gamma-glutamate capsule biosynthesis protein CapA/YwtB (metallophosphatase superfamily)
VPYLLVLPLGMGHAQPRVAVGQHRQGRRGWTVRRVAGAAGRAFVFLSVAGALQVPPGSITTESAVAPSPAPSPPPVLATETKPGPVVRRFDIVASGDLLIHSPIYQQALSLGHGRYDFRPMLAPIRPIIRRAALAICHVETPMGAGPPSGYPVFNTPAELAAAIRWTGWDVCDTASNHSVDRGQAGIDSTLEALDHAGVRHAGSYRTAAAARRILMLQVQGVRIAFLAYAYGLNGLPSPEPWSVNIISLAKIRADARRARRLGANLVIVNLHWGTELQHEPNADQASLAQTLLRRHVVDAIIGQHAHVVQPIREIAGRFVVYGEGNLFSAQHFRLDVEDGIIAVLHVRAVGSRASVTGVDDIPTWVERPGTFVVAVGAQLANLTAGGEGHSFLAAELRASYERSVAAAGQGTRIHAVPPRLQ